MDDLGVTSVEDRLDRLFMSSLVDREVLWAEIAEEIVRPDLEGLMRPAPVTLRFGPVGGGFVVG